MRAMIFILLLAVSGCIYLPVNHREPITYNVPRQARPENKIRLGMSMAEVKEKWGEPIKIIKSKG